MTTWDRPTSDSFSSRRFKRSLSSKFTSFVSRSSAHINNFSIELDEPLRQYGPGDVVKGKVILNVAKPLGVTHVVACLYGYVQVFKNNSRTNIYPRDNSKVIVSGQNRRWVSEYYGDGFASLFEEEVVLCGEGRLDPKLYHFKFALAFPTDLSLPSSIDFEKGTIHYMVWSTITRPSPIISTTTCEMKVFFRDHVDVGILPSPKHREVTLRAMEHSNKPRSSLKRLASSDKKGTSRASTMSKTNHSNRTLDSQDGTSVSRNPSISLPSSRSSSGSRGHVASLASGIRSSNHSISPKRVDLDGDRGNPSIAISVEPSRTGCLPGEIVSVLVRITHIKAVQSLRGVILTLYRQARTDMHPNLPVVTNSRGRTGQYEDYYPRSKTGLGGLSLSAAGSSQAWRKDLAQACSPLYIDHRDLKAEIKVAVRIPDDVFPSISNVPGEMISFKYFLEVIIDIHGKLGTGDRALSNLNSSHNAHYSHSNSPRIQASEAADYLSMAVESDCIDTTAIRREKNAVVVQVDLLIGTKDSEKTRGKQKVVSNYVSSAAADDGAVENTQLTGAQPATSVLALDTHNYDNGHQGVPEEDWHYYDDYDHPGHRYEHDGHYDQQTDDNYNYEDYPADQNNYEYYHSRQEEPPDRPTFPFTSATDVVRLSEKEQLRRAEEGLLPSQPPNSDYVTTCSAEHTPSAPTIPQEGQFHGNTLGPAVSLVAAGSAAPAAADGNVGALRYGSDDMRNVQVVLGAPPAEDKQELERQRLQALISRPDVQSSIPLDQPSAPSENVADDAEFESAAFGGPAQLYNTPPYLPRYER